MKEIRKHKHITIKAETPQEFDRQINAVLDEASEVELKTHDTVPYLAYIRCTYYVLEPENICDEYELKGEIHYCAECRHLDTASRHNSRQKIYPCKYSKYGKAHAEAQACEVFYEEMEAGYE